ncbi:MAG: nucleotidyl transferase AbiEii/AbiGii toxin family protein [Algicola sp.]|nr:nucleotidyl transferase AbiEii/AbiGii toxin family protein [Algicola sp.]
MKAISLTERANLIVRAKPELGSMLAVVEKELLHYDIFYLLQSKGLMLPEMVFIGGTCLRLCHHSNRYSEDLDFHAGVDFKPSDFDAIRFEIEKFLFDRYQLPVEVRSPKQLKNDPEYANSNANTWKVIIQTHPEQRHIPSQRVHIDIANVPVHEVKPLLIRTNYDELPAGYDTLLVNSASLNEILADKLIAVPARNNIKARDLWDIVWLLQKNATVDEALVLQKIADHAMTNYKQRLEARINEIPRYFEGQFFQKEMSRFLDATRLQETVLKPEFVSYVDNKISQILQALHQALFGVAAEQPQFKL